MEQEPRMSGEPLEDRVFEGNPIPVVIARRESPRNSQEVAFR